MNSPLISVIIPCHNAEHHLEKSVGSVLSQTYSNLEVILVDDGSTDGSLETARTLAASDSRIQVIVQANQGVSTARNTGIEAARGELIHFLDADDWLEPDAYAIAADELQNPDVDFVTFGYWVDTPNLSSVVSVPSSYLGFGDTNRGLEVLLETQNRFAWSRVFRRSAIGSARFDPEIHWGEDTVFVAEVAAKARGSWTIPEPLYHYEQSEGSATRSAANPKRLSGLLMTERLRQLIGHTHPALLYTVLTTRVNMLATLIVDELNAVDGRSAQLMELRKMLAKDLQSVFYARRIRPQTKLKAVAAVLEPRLLARRERNR